MHVIYVQQRFVRILGGKALVSNLPKTPFPFNFSSPGWFWITKEVPLPTLITLLLTWVSQSLPACFAWSFTDMGGNYPGQS